MTRADHSAEPLPVICVLGAFSSGTSAIAGYIAKAGAYSCPPHFVLNDPRAPHSLEPVELRRQCCAVIDERTLRKTGDLAAFERWLSQWLRDQSAQARAAGCHHLVIKHPLLMALVPSIARTCNAQWVMVTRPLSQIEQTRNRRRWHPALGEQGAKALYPLAFSSLVALEQTYLTVSFPAFRRAPAMRASLLQWLELSPDAARLEAAEAWMR